MRLLRGILILLITLAVLPLLNFGIITVYGFLNMADKADFETADYFLIPGAGRNYPESPNPNYAFLGRVKKAAVLHAAYPDRPIILSGYEDGALYREAHDLKDALILKGVKADNLLPDTSCRDTYASLNSYKSRYGDRKVVIITQRMHLDRMLWMASKLGISAKGCEAPDPPGGSPSWLIYREFGARLKARLVLWGVLDPDSIR